MKWGGTKMKVNVDDVFAYNIALYVTSDNEDDELKSIKDYGKRKYLQMERDNSSEIKLALWVKLFGLVVRTLEDVKLIRYIQFFARENYIDKIHMYRVWYVHRKWDDICLMFMFKRHIHLKWIQELFLAWLSLVSHERLNLYERCVAI